MASIWTVPPDTTRVEGDWDGNPFWLELKQDLNEGERRRVSTAGFKGMTGFGGGDQARRGGEPREAEILIDWTSQSLARTLAYLVDWSLLDDKGNKLPVRRDTIEALHPGVYDAIEQAINGHVERRAQEKKLPAGEPKPRPTSE